MNSPKSRWVERFLVVLAGCAAIIGLSSCGNSVVTRGRLERSLPETFANLYVQQSRILGHPGVTVKSLRARAYCDKGGPKIADHGPGADWTCLMSWNDPNVPLPDGTGKFELNVHSNDCYTVSGPTKLIGLLAITDTRGNDVPNPVFEFDSCFNPKSPDSRPRLNATPAALTLPTGSLIPDATGHVAPEFRCSRGAAGGCAGTLTAKLGASTVGTVRYALPPRGKNTFPFALSTSDSKHGGKLVLAVTPLIGTAPRNSTSLTVSKH